MIPSDRILDLLFRLQHCRSGNIQLLCCSLDGNRLPLKKQPCKAEQKPFIRCFWKDGLLALANHPFQFLPDEFFLFTFYIVSPYTEGMDIYIFFF